MNEYGRCCWKLTVDIELCVKEDNSDVEKDRSRNSFDSVRSDNREIMRESTNGEGLV